MKNSPSRFPLAAISLSAVLLLMLAEACGALPFPLGGPPPTPSDEQKPQPGEVYINDPLGGYAKWGTGDMNGATVTVNSDQMTIEDQKAEYFITSALTHQTVHGDYDYGLSSWLDQGDVDLAFDATVEQDAGSFALAGAACRYQNGGTFYAFILQSDGKYTIRKFVGEKVTRLVDVTPSSAIRTGRATNQVHIICVGNRLQLWVNGTQLANLTDDELKWGGIAMAGGAGDNPGTRVSFQNLIVTAPYPNDAAFAHAMATQTEYANATVEAAPTELALETATAQAAPTAMAVQTASGIAIVTDTANSAPCLSKGNSNIPSPSAVPPGVANWHVLLSDSFDRAANDWTVGTYSTQEFSKVAQSIVNREYCWELVSDDDFVLNRDLPDMNPLSDLAVSVDARQVSGTANSPYGLVWRDDGLNYYVFEVADDQTYRFGRAAVGIADSFLVSGKSSVIRPGQWNRLTVVAEGAHFTFFVNGQSIAQADHSELKTGQAGPEAELFHKGDHGVFAFGNFELRAP